VAFAASAAAGEQAREDRQKRPPARYPTPVKLSAVGVALVLVAALAAAGRGAAQPSTTAPPQVANVKVFITDTQVRMTPKFAQRGSVARFILFNNGKKPHKLVFGHEKHGTGVQTGFTKALKPNEQAILILFLDYRGLIQWACTLPADRKLPGMRGTFRII
jgi:hypothetical protein